MAITVTMSPYVGVLPLYGVQARAEFVARAEYSWTWITTNTIAELELFKTQANALETNVNAKELLADNYGNLLNLEVETGKYSAKEFAVGDLTTTGGSAKAWATKETTTVDGVLYSSKEYASGDLTTTGGSAKAWATDINSPDGTTSKSAKTLAGEAVANVALTNADVVLTHADVVLTHADVALTHADVVLTHADVALTHADVISSQSILSTVSAAPLWVTGSNYVQYAVVTDPTDMKTYKAKVALTNSIATPSADLANWADISSGGSATVTTTEFVATAGQTIFNIAYTVGFLEVYQSGVLLSNTDYVALNGTSVTLNVGALVGQIISIKVWNSFNVANTYTKAEVDGIILPLQTQKIINNKTYFIGGF